MKSKRTIGITIVGVFSLLFGIYSLGTSISFYQGQKIMMKESFKVADDTLLTFDKSLQKVFQDKASMEKLERSGNVEKYVSEHARLRKHLIKLTEEFKAFYPQNISISNSLTIFMTVAFMINGVGLFMRRKWARKSLFICICLGVSYYLCALYSIYKFVQMIQFIGNVSYTLNFLIDPAYAGDFSKYASTDKYVTLKQFIYGYPAIICHLILLSVVMGLLWYFNRAVIKDQFKK